MSGQTITAAEPYGKHLFRLILKLHEATSQYMYANTSSHLPQFQKLSAESKHTFLILVVRIRK